jgi:uncharacterized membrane protein YfcA
MDFLTVTFPISGVETWLFLPPLVAFIISFFTSMAGVSGAFILLPFQMSILKYTAPSVSATNQVFNIVAIPAGVWRYIKEKRMVLPLTWAVIIGTLPGVFIGAWMRVVYLPDARNFKVFAGLVLFYIAIRLLIDVMQKKTQPTMAPSSLRSNFIVSDSHFSFRHISFRFGGEPYAFSLAGVFLLCFLVGIIGGIYGIGGGAILAPFFITLFHLPVYAVAGAALMGTFITSIAGVVIYQVLDFYYTGMSVAPDWHLGFLFGLGGFCGMYLGARCQKYVSVKMIKIVLSLCVFIVSAKYIAGFFI